jgi:CRISPR system Cascade subunit CasB
MTKPNYSFSTQQFLDRLGKLDNAARARLKRSAGRPLAEARDSLGLFYRLLPAGVHPAQEEWYFLIATLYPLADAGASGNLGSALRRASDQGSVKGINRRFEILIDSDSSQLPFRLRQAVRFLNSKEVAVNWTQMLEDVLHWNHPSRYVQKQWARSFFAAHTPSSEQPETVGQKEAANV